MRLDRASFTLIELLIVIAVVAILSVVVLLVLNPTELLKQARDSNRISDMDTLNRAMILYIQDRGGSLGTASTTYLSLVDPTATSTAGTNCAGVGLTAPVNWNYHCAASSTQRKIDGTGWIPLNFSQMTFNPPMGALPVDPTNTSSSGLYYMYIPGTTTYAISAQLDSSKFLASKGSGDLGVDPARIESGSNLSLIARGEGLIGYWPFDDGSGSVAADASGKGFTGTLMNSPTWTTGKVGGALTFARASDQYVDPGALTAAKGNYMTVTAWFKPTELNNNRIISSYYDSAGLGSDPDNGFHARDYLMVTSGGKLRGGISSYNACSGGGNINLSTDSAASVATGTWSFGAMTLDYPSGTVKLYMNGEFQSQMASTTANCQSDFNYLWIGRRKLNVNMDGQIDDVRVYSRILTPAEISAIYNSQR